MNATGDSTGENFPPGQSSPFLQGRRGLPRWLTGKEFAYSAGDTGSLPGPGRSPGEGNGNPLQYSQLENPMHREAWWVTVHWGTRVGHNLETATATAKSLQQERNNAVSVLGQNDYLCKKSQKSTKKLLVLTVSLLANC